MLFDFVTVLDGFSQQIHLACKVPRSSSRVGQPIRVDEPDHAVIPGDVEMQGEEFEVGANDENLNFQRVPDQPSEKILL